ncbi:3-oxoadipate enol-lactonase [Pseudoponticoccus marisrubri]|uniref:3-oxoadipate enol-lactonase n=1 Tax=Pseudoponticoccus marisrubri TaxID=1685382 RepID=A0A0W7WGJ9_9RHOB|nr:3-oxoadipate enol-lactonase [Pseudoponticoccus marisrubri]KUF09771.1 3-oxoadipate enol-lactonase [Pseudoponticoccus marisrubri]
MDMAQLGDLHLHYRIDGPADGAPVVFANSLGTDLRLWDPILPHLPQGLRILRFDKRGHGLSDCPAGPYSMGALVRDAERVMEQTGFSDAIFVGLSIGGMIAQGLAAKRPDLVRAAVLSNTGAKIGTREMWGERIAAVEAGGLGAVVDATMQRWFSAPFHDTPAFPGWRNMFLRTPATGWTGCAAAIAGTDFYSATAGLRLPVLGIAGTEDGSTPVDLVRETTDLVPGSRFEIIRGAGHLPCVEAPEAYARILTDFLKAQGHV